MSVAASTSEPAGRRSTTAAPVDISAAAPIQLLDHTKTAGDDEPIRQAEPEAEYDDPQRAKSTASEVPLSPKATRVSLHLREEISRRKWARYQEDRTGTHKRKRSTASNLTPPSTPVTPSGQESFLAPHEEGREDAESDVSDTWGESALERGTRHAKEHTRNLLPKLHTQHHGETAPHPQPQRRPTSKSQHDGDGTHSTAAASTAIDVLYENQRGTFVLGLPMFSSKSLLQFDAAAWTDAHGHAAPADIRSAQVPDPSWAWAWRAWYVDMARDVDEEGWEYAFCFAKAAAWHGNHPWHLSFVRRRRWVRQRVRQRVAPLGKGDEAHALNPDYFTIHEAKKRLSGRPTSPGSEGPMSFGATSSAAPLTSAAWGAKDWKEVQEEEFAEIASVPALMKALRRATVDREKILYVMRFVEQGHDELYYLADEMHDIMRLFVFQNGRMQLLATLMRRFDEAKIHRDEHEKRGEEESEAEQKYIDNLLRAVEAADEQCRRLEYWSDIKGVAREGEGVHAGDRDRVWGHDWQGILSTDAELPSPATPAEKSSENISSGDLSGKGSVVTPAPETKQPEESHLDKVQEKDHSSKITQPHGDKVAVQSQKPDKGKAKVESIGGDSEITPEQMLKRQNTPGVWPSSSEREASDETQKSRSTQESDNTTLKESAEEWSKDPSHNIEKPDDVSGEDPPLEQMLRRRSTPGVWIDGTTDKPNENVGTMDPTSTDAKDEHRRQHDAMGTQDGLADEDESSKKEIEKDRKKDDNGADRETPVEDEDAPYVAYHGAEEQLSENLHKLQAELENDHEHTESSHFEEQKEGNNDESKHEEGEGHN